MFPWEVQSQIWDCDSPIYRHLVMVSVWGCMSSAARAELKSGEGSSGETIATVAQTTDFCKTLSWREVYANSLVALGPGPENNGNSYHLCLWHNPSLLVEGSGSLCLEIKKEIRELGATSPCSPFKNTHLGRPTQATTALSSHSMYGGGKLSGSLRGKEVMW